MLSVIFNYKLNLLVKKELFNDLNLELNDENFFTILFNRLNKDNFYKAIANNVDFNCNDGKTSFSKDTMIYYEKRDDFLQNKYNCKKDYFSIQNENNLKLSFLKNTLHHLRNCFEYLTCHIQALQSYFYKSSQWSIWLDEIELPKHEYYKILKFYIQYELYKKLFKNITLITVKKCKVNDFYVCIAKYKIKDLEFKYKASGQLGTENSNNFDWALQVKFFNNENNIVNLVENNNKKIIINLTYLNIIKDHLKLNDNKYITDEMLIEAILLACPQWNILSFIKKDYNITKISFDNQDVFLPICDSRYIEEEEVMSPITQTMQHDSFTILNLPDEIFNCICDYLYFIKDGLSFCLVSKDIYYAIYNTNRLFLSNRIINSFIPLIMTEIYNQFNKQKLKGEFSYKYNFYHDLSFNDTDYAMDTHYFPLFTTCISRIEYFIGKIDSIQRYIYVKQNEWNGFLAKVNDKHVVKQLQDKVFSKVIYKYSQINALDDKWIFKTLFNIKDKIQFEQIITFFENNNEVTMSGFMVVLGEDKMPDYEMCFNSDLPIEELQDLRQWLELDERVSIDCLAKCLKYCSPLKYEFIEFCEKNMN